MRPMLSEQLVITHRSDGDSTGSSKLKGSVIDQILGQSVSRLVTEGGVK